MAEWKHHLRLGDVWRDEEMTLPTRGQVIVDRIRSQPFYKSVPDGDDLPQIVEELEDAAAEDDVRWFDLVWSAFYDWADDNRVWVDTMKEYVWDDDLEAFVLPSMSYDPRDPDDLNPTAADVKGD